MCNYIINETINSLNELNNFIKNVEEYDYYYDTIDCNITLFDDINLIKFMLTSEQIHFNTIEGPADKYFTKL